MTERPTATPRRPRRWRLVLARRDAVPGSLRRLFARARVTRPMVLGLTGAGLAVVLLVTGLILVYQTSLFAVRQVAVAGSHVLSATQVRTAAEVPDGVPLASVDLAAVRRRVAALPPVRTVTVTRDWPHTVQITIAERVPVAAVPKGKQYHLIDGTGLPFRTVAARPSTLPILVVSHPGQHDASTEAALQVLRALTPKLRAALVRLEASRPTRIRLILHNGLTVVWGDSSASSRKAAAATALLGRADHTIDVSAPDLAVVR